ncbi:MAG: nucleotide pyrophosphohydrolase, partial [Phycisphaerales bacterium]
MADAQTMVQALKDEMKRFVAERDWEQFHDLKSLSMAVAVEAGELMDHFRWIDNRTASEVMTDPAAAAAVRHEVADVLLLLLEFAMVAGIDASEAAAEKLALNRAKY